MKILIILFSIFFSMNSIANWSILRVGSHQSEKHDITTRCKVSPTGVEYTKTITLLPKGGNDDITTIQFPKKKLIFIANKEINDDNSPEFRDLFFDSKLKRHVNINNLSPEKRKIFLANLNNQGVKRIEKNLEFIMQGMQDLNYPRPTGKIKRWINYRIKVGDKSFLGATRTFHSKKQDISFSGTNGELLLTFTDSFCPGFGTTNSLDN